MMTISPRPFRHPQQRRSGLDGLFGDQRDPQLDTESLAHALFGTLNALALFITHSQDAPAARARAGQTLARVLRGLAGQAEA